MRKAEQGPGWDDTEDPLSSLARELRQSVGSELRAEAETAEQETELGASRDRSVEVPLYLSRITG